MARSINGKRIENHERGETFFPLETSIVRLGDGREDGLRMVYQRVLKFGFIPDIPNSNPDINNAPCGHTTWGCRGTPKRRKVSLKHRTRPALPNTVI